MSSFLKWFGILVIVLSFVPMVFGAIVSLDIVSLIPAQTEGDLSVFEAILFSLGGQILFAAFVGFGLLVFLAGAVSYFIGNSGIQGSKQLALLRELLKEWKRFEHLG